MSIFKYLDYKEYLKKTIDKKTKVYGYRAKLAEAAADLKNENARKLLSDSKFFTTLDTLKTALLTAVGSAASITHTIGAGAMPGHTNEKRTVIAIVRRPPFLTVFQ